MHKTLSESDGIFQAIRRRFNVRGMVYNPITIFTFFYYGRPYEDGRSWVMALEVVLLTGNRTVTQLGLDRATRQSRRKSKAPCNDKYSYVIDHYILETKVPKHFHHKVTSLDHLDQFFQNATYNINKICN
jgi:hypothetical protein